MTAPPVIDLELPTDQQLAAAAAPDPYPAAARLLSGSPDQLAELGRAFVDAGTDFDGLVRSSQQTQRRLADGFSANGAPVYDGATHAAALPSGFRDAGGHLQALGRRIGAISDELRAASTDATDRLRGLQAELDRQRRAWRAELAALGGPEHRFPAEAVAGLLARRDAVATQLQNAVNACGRAVTARIERYEQVLAGCLRLVGEFDHLRTGPAAGPAGRQGTRLDPLLRAGPPGHEQRRPDVAPLTVPGAAGPAVEIFPLPDGVHLEGTTVTPPAPGGPAVDLTVPAPQPETRTDQGQLAGAAVPPGIHIDASDADQPSDAVGDLDPGERLIADEAHRLYHSPELNSLREAASRGVFGEVRIGDRTVIYEPDLPAEGLSLFGENGFVVGPRAFVSEQELGKTIAHELHRLHTSQGADGVSSAVAEQETIAAKRFADRVEPYVRGD